MHDSEYARLVGSVIGDFTAQNSEIARIVRRLHETDDYQFFYRQWKGGMTDRIVRLNIKRCIMDLGYEPQEK